MISDTIQQIERQLQSAEHLSVEKRAALLELLANLKGEVAELSKTHSDDAQNIAGFAQISAREAIRTDKNASALEHSLAGMTSSVKGFEESHPRLVQVVNSICTTLSNLGI